MARIPVPHVPADPYHITGRCLNREEFPLPIATVWSIMEDYLYLVAKLYGLRIHAFVLMPNHFHLVLTAPEGNLSRAMEYFMRETSREISRLSHRINQTYGCRHHKTHIGHYLHLLTAYKYVYRNPVRARLCERVEEYRFSTLHGLCGFSPLVIPMDEDQILFTPRFEPAKLDWLNRAPRPGLDEEVRRALRRAVIEFRCSRETGRQSVLETTAL